MKRRPMLISPQAMFVKRVSGLECTSTSTKPMDSSRELGSEACLIANRSDPFEYQRHLRTQPGCVAKKGARV